MESLKILLVVIRLHKITGQKFGKLTALKPTDKRTKDRSIIWLCQCDCGKEKLVSSTKLISGDLISCGCLRPEVSRKALIKAKSKNNVLGTNIGLIKKKTLRSDNSSGVTGVRWNKLKGKWISRIYFQGKEHYIGTYKNFIDAVDARKNAEQKFFGEFLEQYNV